MHKFKEIVEDDLKNNQMNHPNADEIIVKVQSKFRGFHSLSDNKFYFC